MFCTLGEQTALRQREPGITFPQTLTADRVHRWVAKVREVTGQRQFIVTLDTGWYKKAGDYQQDRDRFHGNLRGFVDELHEEGLKVLFWFSPFQVDPDSEFAEGHPKALFWKDGKPFRDLAHPAARAQLKFVVSRAVSAEPGGYNADGLKVDLGSHPSPLDPLPMQLIYEAAHGSKADALVTGMKADPSLMSWMDMVRLADGSKDDAVARAEETCSALRAMGGVLLDTSVRHTSPEKAREHWMLSVAYGKPGTYHIEWFDGLGEKQNTAKVLAESDLRRLAAAWAVYALAPVHPSMRVFIDPEQELYGRKYAFGNLPGFWAALALSRRCVATYAHKEARVAATDNHEVVVPLPPRITVKSVSAVLHTGEEKPHRFSAGPDGVCITVPDASGSIRYVRFTW